MKWKYETVFVLLSFLCSVFLFLGLISAYNVKARGKKWERMLQLRKRFRWTLDPLWTCSAAVTQTIHFRQTFWVSPSVGGCLWKALLSLPLPFTSLIYYYTFSKVRESPLKGTLYAVCMHNEASCMYVCLECGSGWNPWMAMNQWQADC